MHLSPQEKDKDRRYERRACKSKGSDRADNRQPRQEEAQGGI